MWKKTSIMIVVLGLAAVSAFAGFGVWRAASQKPSFEAGGYILQGSSEETKQLSFLSGETYTSTLSGSVRFTDSMGSDAIVARESFVHFDDNSVMALSDGILLDFNDLSENFINNYFISAKLRITEAGGSYTAETSVGSMKFGEHLWKISEQKYMIESPTLQVHLSEDDVREVNDYIQVAITEDQIVHLLTPENLWMTISENCYIETAGGVKIYPVTQLVDDGTYKLSLAKLSVSTEDAIVLTEDETRRQIVPELNIEAIDGADGENGENGQIGQDGEAGQAGEDGTAGENGADGREGEAGATGSTGASGASGSTGASGANGANGSGGKNGGNGSAGKDAVAESSTNSALPTMTIKDWQVSATGLKGTIAVSDPGEFLTAVGELTDSQTKYPGKVTITNLSTGAVIDCFEVTYNEATGGYTIPDGDTAAFGFYNGAEEVFFSTKGDPLEPDTQYSLSVTAYYKATDQSSMIYSREFISRIFYTDSTGVYLSCDEAEQEGLTVSAALSSDYQSSLSKATVYLLTPSQDAVFTTASLSDTTGYTGSCELNFGSGLSAEAAFSGLAPNTSYIARVYVETTGGLKTLTSQRLEVMTLKRTPTTESGAVPTAYYNRVTGAFEVYRPVVTDQDGGAVSYTYTAYRLNEGKWVKESGRTITPSTGEPVEFHLQSGETYRFGVELEFNDNEKTVYYDLGLSSNIKSEGDSMPKITLTPEDNGVDWNKYKGTLRIALGTNSSITVDTNHPLRLEFYADQIQNVSVGLTDGTPVKDANEDRYTITMNDYVVKNTNQLDISLDLENLYKNTNYAVTVYGYLNVNDGNEAVSRAIGTVSFRTYDTLTLNAAWSSPQDTSTSIARTLTLSVKDDAATGVRRDYAIEELKDGQVTVELFSGTGVGKLRIAQKNFNETADLDALFGTGLTITEEAFGSPQLSASGNYTLTVSAVTDRSYIMTELGYVNSFDSVLNASTVVTAEPTPPDLLADSSQGVKAAPIYNKDAVTYGGSVEDKLPDDAIIGYTLEATYDNVQRIGKSVTYYTFEYNTFFNALRDNKDPLTVGGAPLMEITLTIDSGRDTVPKVAILFGGTKSDTGSYKNGYYTYFAGEPAQPSGSLVSGMGRGYRYIFAYTVEYVVGSSGDSETTRIYPYAHKEYDSYNNLYGGVKGNGARIGNKVAYILNSGMCNAPAVMPDFHTYVYTSQQDSLAPTNATTASGSVTIHYTWRDPDGLINTDNTTANNTKILCENSGINDPFSQNIQQYPVTDGAGWYSATIPYTIAKGTNTALSPAVDITEYRVNYSNALGRLDMTPDAESYPICTVPVEWSWGEQFKVSGYLEIDLTMNPNYQENYIAFRFDESDTAASALVSRAVAMKLTFQTTNDEGNEKTFLLPMISEAGNRYVKLATGLLGSEYLGKDFTVTKAELLYDTGVQGWSILEQQSALFALQYKNSSTDLTSFTPSNYIGATALTNTPANGALLSLNNGSFSLEKLRGVIASSSKEDAKLPLVVYNRVTTADGYWRYLYPTRLGVDVGVSTTVSQLSGQYLVPKQVGSYDLKFQNDSDTGTLSEMTPTIDKPDFNASSSKININRIGVSGFSTGGGTIYVAAYTDRDSAEKLAEGYDGVPRTVTIGTDGRPTSADIALDNLTGETRYYLAFYYIKDGKSILLLDSNSADAAIYAVTTSSKAVINAELLYRNDSYFDKSLVVDYTISRIFDLSITYDIFKSEIDAESENGGPILSNEDMVRSSILTAPSTVSYNNEVTINLTPSNARSALRPGTTYYLKITAKESNGTEAGSAIVPFTITAVGNYGALIYVSDAGKDSITFQVTINDPQFSLMGRSVGGENGAALYAVRFTDGNGNVLRTSYDDEVYSASELRKEFVLSNDKLKNDGITINNQLNEDTAYSLNIYAVPDADHDGTITLGSVSLGWEEFFDKTASALKDCGKQLLDIINSFWNTDTSSKSDQRKDQLLIATKQQRTLPESGWIMNEDDVYATRYDPTTIRIQFDESVGLLSGEDPVFKQIDWSVVGRTTDGTPVNVSGQSVLLKSDLLLQARASDSDYNGYYYDIPTDLGQGTYTIVLQFRTMEGTAAPDKAITIRSGV